MSKFTNSLSSERDNERDICAHFTLTKIGDREAFFEPVRLVRLTTDADYCVSRIRCGKVSREEKVKAIMHKCKVNKYSTFFVGFLRPFS